MNKKGLNKGFTLVELAIVLVIIGLLVGGVLQGQELIKQAQIRNVISTLNQFDAAVNTFRAKYNNALPGDFDRVVAFGIGTNAQNTGTGDADGDGDGILEDSAPSTNGIATAFTGEIANFWVELTNTSLIKGNFDQSPASTAVGTAYPTLPVGTGAIAVTNTAGNRLEYVVGVASSIASAANSITASTHGTTLSAEDAYGLDSKLDDGSPVGGIVQSIGGYSNAGAFSAETTGSATCNSTTDYNVSLTSNLCTIRVRASS